MHNVYVQAKCSPRLWAALRGHASIAPAPRPRPGRRCAGGRRDGELRTRPRRWNWLNDMFVGAMLVRTVLRPDADLPEGLAEEIVDTLLEGLRPALTGRQSAP